MLQVIVTQAIEGTGIYKDLEALESGPESIKQIWEHNADLGQKSQKTSNQGSILPQHFKLQAKVPGS